MSHNVDYYFNQFSREYTLYDVLGMQESITNFYEKFNTQIYGGLQGITELFINPVDEISYLRRARNATEENLNTLYNNLDTTRTLDNCINFINAFNIFISTDYPNYTISLIWSGRNDYYHNEINEHPHIPAQIYDLRNWAVMGGGLYTTTDYQTASGYGDASISSLYDGGRGCATSKKIIGLTSINNTVDEYRQITGRWLMPMAYYYSLPLSDADKQELWRRLTTGIDFIANIESQNNTEIIFLANSTGKIKINTIYLQKNIDICNTPFNKSTNNSRKSQAETDDFQKTYPHICHTDGSTCPSSCKYLRSLNRLPQNNISGTIKIVNCTDGTFAGGNRDIYKEKYLKYKNKYINLKQKINM